MNILIVDDSSFVRKLVARCFEGLAVTLWEAGDGVDALRRFRSIGGADVVVTDWNMPNMTGLELVEELRKERDLPAPKIIMITTENDQIKIVEALEAGCDDFLMKPFQKEELRSRLSSILGPDILPEKDVL